MKWIVLEVGMDLGGVGEGGGHNQNALCRNFKELVKKMPFKKKNLTAEGIITKDKKRMIRYAHVELICKCLLLGQERQLSP